MGARAVIAVSALPGTRAQSYQYCLPVLRWLKELFKPSKAAAKAPSLGRGERYASLSTDGGAAAPHDNDATQRKPSSESSSSRKKFSFRSKGSAAAAASSAASAAAGAPDARQAAATTPGPAKGDRHTLLTPEQQGPRASCTGTTTVGGTSPTSGAQAAQRQGSGKLLPTSPLTPLAAQPADAADADGEADTLSWDAAGPLSGPSTASKGGSRQPSSVAGGVGKGGAGDDTLTPDQPQTRYVLQDGKVVGYANTLRRYGTSRPVVLHTTPFSKLLEQELMREEELTKAKAAAAAGTGTGSGGGAVELMARRA